VSLSNHHFAAAPFPGRRRTVSWAPPHRFLGAAARPRSALKDVLVHDPVRERGSSRSRRHVQQDGRFA
jgi:hypothetical protein